MKKKWSIEEAKAIFDLPFLDLLYRAQQTHRENFPINTVQVSTLLSIKTGSCPEDCSYCPQSAHYNTGLKKEALMRLDDVVRAAQQAKDAGSTRFCMGAAWRGPTDSDLDVVCQMVSAVKAIGLETCVTLGLLKDEQAAKLKNAGLDYYNHNIDTSPGFYDQIITTRNFQDRIETIKFVRQHDIKVCCGGILGMGETNQDRVAMLVILANFDEHPESIPINKLIKVAGVPLAEQGEVDSFEFVKTIALTRIMMPKSYIRLSAGREDMSAELQALCFMAGVNSIFYGKKLLTTANPDETADDDLLQKLGINKSVNIDSKYSESGTLDSIKH